jgi:hypothetical protein
MSGRKYLTGVATLAVLIFSAIAAPSAFAEQRAYACSSSAASKTFSDTHCLTAGGGSFGHTLIEGETAVTGTNAKTASGTTAAAVVKLKGALSGVETDVTCKTKELTAGLLNIGPFWVFGFSFKWTGCEVTKPAGKGCEVNAGTIESKKLRATSEGQAANKAKFSPESGTEIASVKIEKCSIAALNNTFPLTGSYVADTSGATITTTHAGITEQNTLKLGGVKAGLESAVTLSTGGGSAVTFT